MPPYLLFDPGICDQQHPGYIALVLDVFANALLMLLSDYFHGRTRIQKAFLEYELSPRGQQIVEEEGFFPIPSEYEEFNTQAGL